MWTGRLTSSFVFDGTPVEVETSVHPERDLIIVRLRSQLLADGRLGVDLKFPGVSREAESGSRGLGHIRRRIPRRRVARGPGGLTLARQLDDTRYSVRVASDRELDIATPAPHAYRLTAPGSTQLTLLVEFTAGPPPAPLPDAEAARAAVAKWLGELLDERRRGGFHRQHAIRARSELERRIVLSQYLTAVNCAGSAAAAGRGPVLQ